jgi:hypothetical protein
MYNSHRDLYIHKAGKVEILRLAFYYLLGQTQQLLHYVLSQGRHSVLVCR